MPTLARSSSVIRFRGSSEIEIAFVGVEFSRTKNPPWGARFRVECYHRSMVGWQPPLFCNRMFRKSPSAARGPRPATTTPCRNLDFLHCWLAGRPQNARVGHRSEHRRSRTLLCTECQKPRHPLWHPQTASRRRWPATTGSVECHSSRRCNSCPPDCHRPRASRSGARCAGPSCRGSPPTKVHAVIDESLRYLSVSTRMDGALGRRALSPAWNWTPKASVMAAAAA